MIPGKGQGQGFPHVNEGGFSKCKCPSCGYEEPHKRNTPCNKMRCPQCGIKMIGN